MVPLRKVGPRLIVILANLKSKNIFYQYNTNRMDQWNFTSKCLMIKIPLISQRSTSIRDGVLLKHPLTVIVFQSKSYKMSRSYKNIGLCPDTNYMRSELETEFLEILVKL